MCFFCVCDNLQEIFSVKLMKVLSINLHSIMELWLADTMLLGLGFVVRNMDFVNIVLN